VTASAELEALLGGCGGIGSRVERACADLGVALTCADRERVGVENLGVALFDAGDVGREKAAVVAARRRARGGVGRALRGDLRYTVRPGLARTLGAAVVCVDNPTALYDVADALWTAGAVELPVFVLTCGGDGGGYQVRCFLPPGPCPVCLWGAAERHADRLARGASCADTTAPRAAGPAAEAAAQAGARLLARWRAGERAVANCRVQRDATGAEFTVRMPATPSPACPIPHHAPAGPVVDLGARVGTLAVGALAERAIACVGEDAELVLGRRGVPLAGLYCPRCSAAVAADCALLPAAEAAAVPSCACGERLRPLGERHVVGARELATSAVADRTLAAWGAGAGDEFVCVGSRGQARLRTAFAWEDIQ
jgi:molybdopterin/thiamine biosynthesis adenylyltransferase